MKKNILITIMFICISNAFGQSENLKYGITVGAGINHYNGNLGNSFFQPKTTCFGGFNIDFGSYVNKSFDFNIGVGGGHFGYCQTQKDVDRLSHLELKCPGCTDKINMVELRSLIISGNVAMKYKFANGYLLKESTKIAPYIYAGAGINSLTDNMKKECVNVGYHFTINVGAGFKYNITEKFNIGYNLGIGCFLTKKVYDANPVNDNEVQDHQDEVEKMEKRKDLMMRNSFTLGMNF